MIDVRLADLESPGDQAATLALLDMYCRDEFGDSAPLSDDARQNLIPGLRAHGGAKVFLAFAEGKAVGLAICFVGFSSFRARPLINIHDIAVSPNERGKGIGQALLAAIEAEGRRIGCCKVTLEVRSDNQLAQHVYAKAGFRGTQPETWFWSKPLNQSG